MGFKDLDYLSQKIAIFYHERNRHSSVFGGILSIFLVFLVATYIFYCIINIYNHKSSNYISYTTRIKDPGYCEFSKNKNTAFHFLQFSNIENNQFETFNPKYIRIFMTRINNGYKSSNRNLKDSEHWVYDKCRKGIDDNGIPESVFNDKTKFEEGACLRYYYNNIEKKYYSVDDITNFIPPSINQGNSTDEFSHLNTIVEKCHNDSILYDILGPCETETEIDKYFNSNREVYMKLLEQQFEAENYDNPIFYYLNSISGLIADDSRITVNNINLSPFKITIKKGIVYPTIKKTQTYIISQNEKEIWQNTNYNKYTLVVFNYMLINTAIIFKGEYNTLYDTLSNIGGIIQCFYYIFFGINFISNKFKIMEDSKNLFFQIKDYKSNSKEEREKSRFCYMSQYFRKTIYNKSMESSSSINNTKTNNLMDQLKKNIHFKISKTVNGAEFKFANKNKNNNKNLHYSRISTHSLLKINYYRNKTANLENNFPKLNEESNNTSEITLIGNRINSNDKLKNTVLTHNRTVDDQKVKNEIKTEFNESNIDNNPETKNYIHFSQNLNKFLNEKRQAIKIPDLSRRYLRQYTSFYHYLISITCPKEKRGKVFYVINKFRKKLISEEHLFNTQIFLYYLEKYFDINDSEKIDFMELYNYL